MATLSEYTYPLDNGGTMNVTVDKLSCGDHHCVALLNIGAVMIWGGNEFG